MEFFAFFKYKEFTVFSDIKTSDQWVMIKYDPYHPMGLVCFPTFMVDFLMVNAGKYTIHGSYG